VLRNAVLRGADLTDARLDRVALADARLEGAILDLTGAVLLARSLGVTVR
jgi:fluoroquinolone resistance protein